MLECFHVIAAAASAVAAVCNIIVIALLYTWYARKDKS